ncbi:LuxR C-terminal-related transcriptional regulator [Streptomyces sp. NPDC051662]|uniref:LuxR C-terminal-related transcriptional regulator n=1 Tax=Streptomyces sp. NPDC051662 TaxID=3154750 RepID=UPI003417D67E
MSDAHKSVHTQPYELSAPARDLWQRLADGAQVPESEPDLQELIKHRLAAKNPFADLWGAGDPRRAQREALAEEHGRIRHHLNRAQRAAELYEGLGHAQNTDSGGVEYLPRLDLATAAISRAVQSAGHYIYTAHPTDRDPEMLRSSAVQDIDLLSRGIRYRTIYPDTARARAGEREWASTVSAHGAEVRTLSAHITRMIIIDGKFAFVSDLTGERSKARAFKVTNSGMLALLESIYEDQWDRAEPWLGGKTAQPTDGATNARSRQILRLLAKQYALAQIAKEMNLSLRTVKNELAKLYQNVGVETLFALGVWWASSDAAEERQKP